MSCAIAATAVVAVAGGVGLGQPQGAPADRLTVPFSDPTRPGVVRVGLVHGGITVKAYEGREVIVEARVREREARRDRTEAPEGLRRIPNTSTGLSIEEESNVMRVSSRSASRAIDLVLQVPRQTSLKLSCVNDGDIAVEGVRGEIEVSNTNGGVTLTSVAGSVVAHALNGDLIASLTTVDADKPMSFSSLNGDIDVTLPPDIRATLKVQTRQGEVYSDFDIELTPTVQATTEDRRDGGRRYRLDSAMTGTINGGGQEIQLKNFNGDIRVRRGGGR